MSGELVLVALDPGDLDGQHHILDAARAEAESRGARMAAVLVVEGAPHPLGGPGFEQRVARLTREATERASDWLDRTMGADRVEAHVAHGTASDEILRLAKRLRATAIVMGERRHRIASRLLGSAARSVSDSAPCPVILVEPVTHAGGSGSDRT